MRFVWNFQFTFSISNSQNDAVVVVVVVVAFFFLSFQCIDVCTSPFTNATVRNGHRTGASQDEMQFSNCLFCVSFRSAHVRLYLVCVYGVVAPFQVNDCLFTINGRSNRQRHTHTPNSKGRCNEEMEV